MHQREVDAYPSIVPPYNEYYYNDLWAYDMSTKEWHLVRAGGLIPSPRAHMGRNVTK